MKKLPGAYSLTHNPGHDFLELTGWLERADVANPSFPFPPYLATPLSILAACCAIEAYVNMVGKHVDVDWEKFDKGPIPLRDRLSRIYECTKHPIDYSQGLWQRVQELFDQRVSLVHAQYEDGVVTQSKPVDDVFDIANHKYSRTRVRKLAESAVDTLLADTGLVRLRHRHRTASYAGPIRPDPPERR